MLAGRQTHRHANCNNSHHYRGVGSNSMPISLFFTNVNKAST